jgi:hypothetical protein
MTYNEQMQHLADQYLQETGKIAATAREMAIWAIDKRLWEAQPSALIKQCAEDFARAMREEYVKDLQGRRVRVKHVAILEEGGEQVPLWADMRMATRDHMDHAFHQRRRAIVGDCKQLKNDVDSYNENFNSGDAIQIVFDFTDDLEEAEIIAGIA